MLLFFVFASTLLLSQVRASAYYIFISSGSFNGSDSLVVADALCESDFVSLGLNLAGSHSGSFVYNSSMFNYFVAHSVPSSLIYAPNGQALSTVSDFSGTDQTLSSTLVDAGACSPDVTFFWTGFGESLSQAQTCDWTTVTNPKGMTGDCTDTGGWSYAGGAKFCPVLYPVMCMYQGSTHAPSSSPVKHPSRNPTKHPSKSPSKAPVTVPPTSSHPTASPLVPATSRPTASPHPPSPIPTHAPTHAPTNSGNVEGVAMGIGFLFVLVLLRVL